MATEDANREARRRSAETDSNWKRKFDEIDAKYQDKKNTLQKVETAFTADLMALRTEKAAAEERAGDLDAELSRLSQIHSDDKMKLVGSEARVVQLDTELTGLRISLQDHQDRWAAERKELLSHTEALEKRCAEIAAQAESSAVVHQNELQDITTERDRLRGSIMELLLGQRDALEQVHSLKQTEDMLRREKRNLEDRLACAVCCDSDKAVLFTPCAHVVCCAKCSGAIQECPLCRTPVRNSTLVFFS
eukprot:TRINITY_DN1684_c0_g1_i1.p1 TRINITY_DN1684_c0_g1~~TRINITY_DN1684_c0_g1_i1.p1  ORF type:complete len:248 (+),score=68.95 TRINITY_DN1684_c0_g1_i1:212-955(+)